MSSSRKKSSSSSSSSSSTSSSSPQKTSSSSLSLLSPCTLNGTMLRGAFDLNEAGAGKALVESIQFQLEGLFPRTKTSSSSSSSILTSSSLQLLRSNCAIKLIQSCCTIDNMRIIRAKGLIKPLLKTASRIDSDTNSNVKLLLLLLILILLRKETGNVIDDSEMPLETFEAILRSSYISIKIDHNSQNSNNSTSPNPTTTTNPTTTNTNSNPIHKKRKLTGKILTKITSTTTTTTTSTTSSIGTPDNGISSTSSCFEFDISQKDDNKKVIDNRNTNIFLEIEKVSPLLVQLLYNTNPNDDDTNEISKLLALTIANRFMVSKVQSLARSSEQRGLTEASTMEELEGKILALYQESLRKEIDNNVTTSFLYNICEGMVQDLNVLIDIKDTHSENLTLDSMDMKSRIRLWQILGLLEASCFRCPENQQYIGDIQLNVSRKTSSSSSSSSSSKSNKIPMPILLLQMLEALTKLVASQVKNADDLGVGNHKSNKNEHQEKLQNKTPIKHEPINATPSKSPLKTSTPMKNDPYTEIERLRNLFPELPMFLSETPSQCNAELVVKVSPKELWLSVLRVLVNLTHKCPEACEALVENNGFDMCYSILALCTSWRGSIFQLDEAIESKKKMGEGALSPKENPLERIAFDASLYVLTLLSNIYEAAPKKVLCTKKLTDCYVDEMLVQKKLDKFIMKKSIVQKLSPDGRKKNNDCGLFIESVILAERLLKVDIDNTKVRNNNAKKADALQLLIAILAVEAEVFLKDIVNTDDTIHESDLQDSNLQVTNSNNKEIISEFDPFEEKHSSGTKRKADSRSVSPDKKSGSQSSQKQKVEENHSGEVQEQLPVAELILGAHVILLLHTIVYSRLNDAKADDESDEYDVDKENIEDRIRCALPRQSWWLGIRILKAFLALQGQTGLLLLESAVPVVTAIKRMELEDRGEEVEKEEKIVSPKKIKKISNTPLKNSFTENDDDWITNDKKIITNDKKTNNKVNEEKGKWVWDKSISDFVWVVL